MGILGAMSKYEAFVRDVRELEPGKEAVLLVEGVAIRVQLVDDEYIRTMKREQVRCPD